MELRQLKAFITIAKFSSFVRAAEALNFAQSTITAQIQLLEEELDTKLFERLGKQTYLTSSGKKLLPYAQRLLMLHEEAINTVTSYGQPKGSLIVGTAESLCVVRLRNFFKTYRERYPEVDLILKFGTCDEFRSLLRNNSIDAAFFLDKPITASDLIIKTILKEDMAVLTSPFHHLAAKDKIQPKDLAGECLIVTENGCSYHNAFDAIMEEACVQFQSTMIVNSLQATKQFTSDGLGVTLLPRIAAQNELADKSLCELDWHGPDFEITMQVVYHKDKWISPALKAFSNLISEMLM